MSSPARLDWAKLNHINHHYIGLADDGRLAGLVMEVLSSRQTHLPHDAAQRLARTIPLVKDGAKTTLELADLTLFALKERPLALLEKDRGVFTDEVKGRLARLVDAFAAETDWTPASLAARMKGFAVAEDVGLGKFAPALRVILAAGAVAPDLAGALAALGPDEALGRVKDALSQVQ